MTLFFFTAKKGEVALLKEIISAKDEEIAHLKETVVELQQNGQNKEIDFAKRLETIDEKLKKTKENISQAQETFLKKKEVVENLSREPELFNGKWL